MSHKVFGVHLTKNKLPGETVPFPLKAMVNWLKENASNEFLEGLRTKEVITLLLMFLRSLKSPFIPTKYYATFIQISKLHSTKLRLNQYKCLLPFIPPERRDSMLLVSQYLQYSGVSVEQLTATFGNVFFRPRKGGQHPNAQKVVRDFIEQAMFISAKTTEIRGASEAGAPNEAPIVRATVLYDYNTKTPNAMSCKKGDTVTLSEVTKEHDWVYALSDDGRKGYIPTKYFAEPVLIDSSVIAGEITEKSEAEKGEKPSAEGGATAEKADQEPQPSGTNPPDKPQPMLPPSAAQGAPGAPRASRCPSPTTACNSDGEDDEDDEGMLSKPPSREPPELPYAPPPMDDLTGDSIPPPPPMEPEGSTPPELQECSDVPPPAVEQAEEEDSGSMSSAKEPPRTPPEHPSIPPPTEDTYIPPPAAEAEFIPPPASASSPVLRCKGRSMSVSPTNGVLGPQSAPLLSEPPLSKAPVPHPDKTRPPPRSLPQPGARRAPQQSAGGCARPLPGKPDGSGRTHADSPPTAAVPPSHSTSPPHQLREDSSATRPLAVSSPSGPGAQSRRPQQAAQQRLGARQFSALSEPSREERRGGLNKSAAQQQSRQTVAVSGTGGHGEGAAAKRNTIGGPSSPLVAQLRANSNARPQNPPEPAGASPPAAARGPGQQNAQQGRPQTSPHERPQTSPHSAPQGAFRGSPQSPQHGQTQSAPQGLLRRSAQGRPQNPVQGSPQAPPQGRPQPVPRNFPQSMSQGHLQPLSQQGHSQAPLRGSLQGTAEGHPHGSSQGSPQGSSQGRPQCSPQTRPQGPLQGHPQPAPRGPAQRSPQEQGSRPPRLAPHGKGPTHLRSQTMQPRSAESQRIVSMLSHSPSAMTAEQPPPPSAADKDFIPPPSGAGRGALARSQSTVNPSRFSTISSEKPLSREVSPRPERMSMIDFSHAASSALQAVEPPALLDDMFIPPPSSKDWRLELNPDESAKLESNLKKRKLVFEELTQTERTYIKNICSLKLLYYDHFKETPCGLTEEDLSKLFINVQVLVNISKHFLSKLDRGVEKWNDDICVSSILTEICPKFKLYHVYIEGHSDALSLFIKLREENKQFRKYIESVDYTEKVGGLSFESLLICPIQRIPRYVLLFKELLKHTPRTHPDYEGTEKACTAIQKIAEDINIAKRRAETSKILLDIQSKIIGCTSDLNAVLDREFVRDVDCKVDKEKYHVFFFNDIVIIGKSAGNKYQYKDSYKIDGMSVMASGSGVIATVGKHEISIPCEEEGEQEFWIKALSELTKTQN